MAMNLGDFGSMFNKNNTNIIFDGIRSNDIRLVKILIHYNI